MPVLSIDDKAFPDDPYTVWRLAERDAELRDLILDDEGGLLNLGPAERDEVPE